MKTKIKFIVIPAIVGLFSCQNKYVTKIVHSYNNNTTKYYHDSKEITSGNPVVKEGTNVSIEIIDYNPLSIDISVNQENGKLNYQENKFSPFLDFLSVPKLTSEAEPSVKDSLNNKYTFQNGDDEMLVSEGDKSDLWKFSDSIEEQKIVVDETIQTYKLFYNSIAGLNNLIEQAKYNTRLDGGCLCGDLQNSTSAIKKYFFDENYNAIPVCGSNLVCKDLISGDELTYQKIKYFEEFNYRLIIIDSLEITLKKLIKKEENALQEGKNKKNEKIKNKKNFSNKEIIEAIVEITNDFDDDLKDLRTRSSALQNDIIKIRKSLTDTKEDYISIGSNNIDLAVNKYKAIGFLEFLKNAGSFKVEETDNFPFTINFENSITNKTTTRKIDIDVIKPLKIDFSAGVFITPYLYDESYDIIQKDSAKYSIKKIDGGKISYGAVGYINFHPVFCNQWLSIGGSIGTGLMFNNVAKIVFSPTVSIFFGKYQRAIIHIGGGFAQVDRIHSLYPDDVTFKDATYKPEIKKELSSSFLFGLSWNLSKK